MGKSNIDFSGDFPKRRFPGDKASQFYLPPLPTRDFTMLTRSARAGGSEPRVADRPPVVASIVVSR